jgi:hypothetical protein
MAVSTFVLDPELEQFATARQWEYMTALEQHGSGQKAADALGVNHKSVINRARVAVYKKAVARGYAPSSDWYHVIPEGHKIRRISTLYGGDDVRNQWVISEPDKQQNAELLTSMLEGLTSQIDPVEPVAFDEQMMSQHLMACYPVGDHHYGMLSWHEETGFNYDLKIAEQRLHGAIDHLVTRAPACAKSVIAFLGDYMHYDGEVPETPTSRNPLDADGRFPDMVKYAIRGLRYTIASALTRHQHVLVIFEPGNHDPSSALIFLQLLEVLYEKEPRVTIDTSPRRFHYFEFGRCLVGTHHGDTVKKMENLGPIMATDQPEAWGRTQHRYWWTGHLHTDRRVDMVGCSAERFRVLAPPDAWAAKSGYRAKQDMKCIVLHREHGEIARYVVNPEMLV